MSLKLRCRLYWFEQKVCFYLIKILLLSVRKYQNEYMKPSHCPKYEQKIFKNSALILQGRFFQIFRSYFGQWDDSIFSFWNFLTFSSTFKLTYLGKFCHSKHKQLVWHTMRKSRNITGQNRSPIIWYEVLIL